jgi:hypothetical protein
MLFTDLIFAVHRALNQAGLEHSFGGALALMHYVAEPRTTWDIDINVSVSQSESERVLQALSGIVVATPDQHSLLSRDGQVRLIADRYPIDVFLAVHDFHDDIRSAVEFRPFGNSQLPYVSATHLTVLKAMFNRPKDWIDIESMLRRRTVDVPRAIGWISHLLGPEDSRAALVRALALLEPNDESPLVRNLFNLATPESKD